jgi:N-acetyl-alpha-D-glucosaminyl L-malate synthase BshA
VVATELGLALAQQGHEIHLITYDMPVRLGIFCSRVFYHEVIPTDYPLFKFPPYESALFSKMVDVALNHQLDLFHVHYAIPHAIAAYVAQSILKDLGFHIPYITTLHGTDVTIVGKDRTYYPVVEFSLNHSNGLTAVSHYLKSVTETSFHVKQPIHVIPNFVDTNQFKPYGHENGGWKQFLSPENEPILIHISNFRKVKRVADLIKVLSLVIQQRKVRLVLIGDGPERPEIENCVRHQSLQPYVLFMGKQERIEQFLPLADLFLLTSETESFGLAALEALACGIPVIAYDVGGIKEVVQHEQNGFLVPKGDIQAMADRVLYLLSQPELLQRFRSSARERAMHFRKEAIVPQYFSLYQQVIAQTRIQEAP